MKEVWKDIKGYEGLYQVSNLGNIRSLPRKSTKGKVLRQHISKKNGYCYVCLSKDNQKKTKRVHKLVLVAFSNMETKDKYDKNITIDHIDGNKTNNRLENLEWCTQSENQKRAFKLGLNPITSKKVVNLDTFQIYNSLKDAAISVGGKKSASITRACKGERSQYRNAHFAYYDDYINNTIPKFVGNPKESCKSLWR